MACFLWIDAAERKDGVLLLELLLLLLEVVGAGLRVASDCCWTTGMSNCRELLHVFVQSDSGVDEISVSADMRTDSGNDDADIAAVVVAAADDCCGTRGGYAMPLAANSSWNENCSDFSGMAEKNVSISSCGRRESIKVIDCDSMQLSDMSRW